MSVGHTIFGASPKVGAGSYQLHIGAGEIGGFFADTNCTITIYDGTSTGDLQLLHPFSTSGAGWFPFPIAFNKGLLVVLSGTNPNATIAWVPTS